MAIMLPQLDDRRFNDLVAELRSLIPRYDRNWTNHNPADPGMTLVELLAWLAEMTIYRLNRIEDRTYRTFLELLGVQPAAPQAVVTFELRIAEADLLPDFVIPRGTRVAAPDADTGEEVLFETLTGVTLGQGRWDEDRSVWVFKAPAVNTIHVEAEFLGFGTGKPHQEFAFQKQAIFLDRADDAYEGNPGVTVNAAGTEQTWRYCSDLLDHVDDPAADANRRFTVEHLTGLVRFGDGPHGAIPPEGAKIFCTYRRLGGARGKVKARAIKFLKDSIILDPIHHIAVPEEMITVFNEYPAEGGVDDEAFADLLARGLRLMTERTRAVSEEDFEALARDAEPGKISRAKAVFDRNLVDSAAPVDEAHVSVIVLPAAGYLWPGELPLEGDSDADPVLLRHDSAHLSAALGSDGTKNLCLDILAFLDQRRLVTTIIHVVGARFTPLSITMTVQAKSGVILTASDIRKRVSLFLDPYRGWLDGMGWPFGRKVYRSELYQQIEEIEGVDHVEELRVNGDTAGSVYDVGEFDLVCINELNVTVR